MKRRQVVDNARVFDKTYQVISKALDISARRHNLITSNVANVDTIGYEPSDLDFQKTLKKMMTVPKETVARTDPRHFSGIDPLRINMNGENSEDVDIFHLDSVDIDTEMSNLVENNIKFRGTTEMLLRKMGLLKHTIKEGGR